MIPYRILLTGSRGQLGSDLMDVLAKKYVVKGIDIDDFDLRDTAKVSDCIKSNKPNLVIHTAAYTDVDGCESNVGLAMESNAIVTKYISTICNDSDAKLIFYSTDYVFDGNKRTSYIETDIPCPCTVYGKSKLDAENYIAESMNDYSILRIAWLYGANGKNFPRTIIKAGLSQINDKRNGQMVKPLIVVNNQIGNPTWTMDVARQTEKVIENDLKGIFHCTSEGETSWYQLSLDIFELLGMDIEIRPCTSEEFPRPAKRPLHSSLENKHFKDLGQNVMRPYKSALRDFLNMHGGELLGSNQ